MRVTASPQPWRTLTLASDGNGGCPVHVLVPPHFDPTRGAIVQTHYHGDGVSALAPNNPAMARIQTIGAANSQCVFVLPEAKGVNDGGGTDWSNAVGHDHFTNDALSAAGIARVAERIVSAHSAGGRGVAEALEHGSVTADRVILLDCLYSTSYARIAAGFRHPRNQLKRLTIVYATTEDPKTRIHAVSEAFPGTVDTIITVTGPDAHNAAVRQHLNSQP